MNSPPSFSIAYKIVSLLSVIRGYNLLVLVAAQYLGAIFIFSPQKSLRYVLLDYQLFFIVLASVCVVSAGYIINDFYDARADKINRPIKAGLDSLVKQHTKLQLYFTFNFLGFLFGWFISWKAAFFFGTYIFCIWLYSHKLKKHPFVGLFSAAILTILPFFAIFVYYKNFSEIIFVDAAFLFLVVLLRELIKDLENLRGSIVNNYTTFPVKYGERNTRRLGIVLVVLTGIPVILLCNYPTVGYMNYYFLLSEVVLVFIAYFLWKSNLKKHYVNLHNVLKIILLLGILSLLFIDPSVVVERVVERVIDRLN
jgi:4-hydroxybenzoate polyprenyltransferase